MLSLPLAFLFSPIVFNPRPAHEAFLIHPPPRFATHFRHKRTWLWCSRPTLLMSGSSAQPIPDNNHDIPLPTPRISCFSRVGTISPSPKQPSHPGITPENHDSITIPASSPHLQASPHSAWLEHLARLQFSSPSQKSPIGRSAAGVHAATLMPCLITFISITFLVWRGKGTGLWLLVAWPR